MRKFFETVGPEAYRDFAQNTEQFWLYQAKNEADPRQALINASRNICDMVVHEAISLEFADDPEIGRHNKYSPTPEFSQFWADRSHSDPNDVWDEWVAKHPAPPASRGQS